MNLYLDCSRGISGDMTLAALNHLGVDTAPFEGILAAAGIECHIKTWAENRAGGPGRRVEVTWDETQPLRQPADIAAIFRRLAVSAGARERALAVLDALTLAEADAHHIPSEKVPFHELGAIDTLVDIAGVCWALDELGAESITASPLPWFSGVVECAHGLLPLPAPATAFLMRGKPVRPVPDCEELVTPTGAALVHVLAQSFANGPAGRVHALGTGYGSRPSPMGLRVWQLQPVAARVRHTRGGLELVTQLETHLDHLTGEELGCALSSLAGLDEVLDVLWLPGTGKKNRPAGLLRVLCRPEDEDAAVGALLRHTHSLGLRRQCLERLALPRQTAAIDCADSKLDAKMYTLEGKDYVRPEADAVSASADRLGLGAPALRFSAEQYKTTT
ncbi:MAG: LarC family nickel insertion protein [Desulfovibrio sp.]|jgi:uncharacterized protein (TIGR00299 family) protein|nr:LarC family nickel insertion protein [Desulfovibrio sp.]